MAILEAIQDYALIVFLGIIILVLVKILVEVHKQTATIKNLQFQLKSHDAKESNEVKRSK